MSRIPRLHLISNREICPFDRLPEVATRAVSGGVGAVHLREPELPDDELSALYSATRAALSATTALVVVNRAVEVAIDVQADGLHLTEAQIAEACAVRKALKHDALIGASIHSVESASQAASAGVDYVIAGHVFKTGSKPGLTGRGIGFIEDVTRAVRIPVIAIGGITAANAASVVQAGAYGVAVMSGILAASDPERAASELVAAMEQAEGWTL